MKFSLMSAFGLELEYMVVDRNTLKIKPIVDQLFKSVVGDEVAEVSSHDLEWSNELVRHVVEIKNPGPRMIFRGLAGEFHREVQIINENLKSFDAMLMPTAMHPTMNPRQETELWPLGYNEIYKTYNKLFDCNNHGWSNLQSMHINLSFANDQEFEKLHTVCRALLSITPALTASSPIVEGQIKFYSSRLSYYLENQKKVPSIMGEGVPDVNSSQQDYENRVLQPMYRDIRKIDASGKLEGEWLNSRGVIPKFERDSLEVRLCDIQENPFIDISVAWFFMEVTKLLLNEEFESLDFVRSLETLKLKKLIEDSLRTGENTMITDSDFLAVFSMFKPISYKDLFSFLLEKIPRSPSNEDMFTTMQQFLKLGTLSTRILNKVKSDKSIDSIYRELCNCLQEGVFFE